MDLIMSEANQWSKWQEKMDNLDHVPGEPLPDIEDLWNRLQQRVQKGRKRRRIYRYGIAASFTIIFSVLLSLSVDKNNGAPHPGDTHATTIPFTPAKRITLMPAPLKERVSPTKEMVQKIRKKKQPSPAAPVAASLVTPDPAMMVQVPVPEILEPVVPLIATSAPAKIRRPIIHIRDLNAYRNNQLGSADVQRAITNKSAEATSTVSSATDQQGYIFKHTKTLN